MAQQVINKNQSAPSYYPPVGFHFRVTGAGDDIDMAFQSVSGLNIQMQTESYKEGGENRYEHTLPVRSKFSDLVLKRGVIVSGQSALTRWFQEAFLNFKFKGKDLTVQLLNQKSEPLMFWKVINALPKEFVFTSLGIPKEMWSLENIGSDNKPTPTIPIAPSTTTA